MHLEVHDVRALVWAVRRELDLRLASFASDQAEQFALTDLREVAEVSGADGFSYLLVKLFAVWASEQSRGSVPDKLRLAVKDSLARCSGTPSLRLAVTEALLQAPQHFTLQLLATETGLDAEQQAVLAITVSASTSELWKQQGHQLLSSVLSSACSGDVILSPKVLHEAYTCVRAENVQLPFPEADLRGLLAKAQQASQRPESVLVPFANATDSLSARVTAQQLSCLPEGPESLAVPGGLPTHLVPNEVDQIKALAQGPLFKTDPEELLATMSQLDTASLAEALRECGPKCTHDEGLLASVLASFPTVTPAEVAHVVALLACSSGTSSAQAASEQDPTLEWDATMLGEMFRSQYPATQWQHVMSGCDVETFLVPDQEGFTAITQFWTAVAEGLSFPVAPFITHPWRNLKGQLSFLLFAIVQPRELMDFTTDSDQERLDPLPVCTDARVANSLQNGAWTCLDFLSIIINASERGDELLQLVLRMLEMPMATAPDVLMLGFGMLASGDVSGIRRKLPSHVISNLATKVVTNAAPSSKQVMNKLYNKAFPAFQYALQAAYAGDPKAITSIFNLVQELGALSAALETDNYLFSIELAVVASRENAMSLGTWMPTQFAKNSSAAVTGITSFLSRKLEAQAGARTIPLEQPTLEQLASVLAQVAPTLSTSERLHLQPVLTHAAQQDPTSPLKTVVALVEVQWPPGTDEKADRLFNQLYEKGEAGVNDLVQQLREMAAGADIETAEYMIQDIFEEYPFFGQYPSDKLRTTAALIGSMIAQSVFVGRSLFLALKMIIECLEHPQATTANEAAHLRTFALNALRAMRPAFSEHPQFCERVLQLADTLRDDRPLLEALSAAVRDAGISLPAAAVASPPPQPSAAAAAAAAAANTGGPLSTSSTNEPAAAKGLPAAAAIPGGTAPEKPPGLQRRRTEPAGARPGSGSAASLPTMPSASNTSLPPPNGDAAASAAAVAAVDEEVNASPPELFRIAQERKASARSLWQNGGQGSETPDTKVSDRVLFLINNFTMDKTQSTGDEIRNLLMEAHYLWFAFHLVRDRAANESQYHDAYIQMVLYLDSPALLRAVVDVCSEGVLFMAALCVESTNLKENHNMRNMLKALGEFLGKLTLRRNVPILRRDLDLRQLLLDGYIYGRLVAVMPVVTAIMTHAKDSPVFSSLSNPWVKLIFGLLKEVYSLENLKLSLMFTFETLCKHHAVDMKSIEATKLLVGLERVNQNAGDFKAPAVPETAHPDSRGETHARSSGLLPASQGGQLPTQEAQLDSRGGAVSAQSAPVPPPPPPSTLQQLVKIPPELQQYSEQLTPITAGCVERAVADIMGSAVERSASISCKATSHIVLKDFVQDPSADRVRVAARNMAASLAVSLAAVTCRDALNSGLMSHLQHALKSVVAHNAVDDVAALLCRTNHPVGCEYVERMALDRAMKDIEDHMAPSLELRRVSPSNQPFADTFATLHQPQIVPPSLQLQPSAPTATQANVYESFQVQVRRPSASIDVRFRNWLEELDNWLSSNLTATYMAMKDHPSQKAILDEITAIHDEVQDPSQVEKMAAALFKHMWSSSPSRYRVTLIVVIIDQLLGRERILTQTFISQQWQRLPEADRWTSGFVEMLVSLNLMHLGDVDLMLAYCIRTQGAGSGEAPAPYLELFENLLKKHVLQGGQPIMDIGQPLFIQDLQCSVAAMHILAEQQDLSGPAAHSSPQLACVIRILSFIHQALAELERQLAAGSCGVLLADSMRMSLIDDVSIVPAQNAQNFTAMMQHRRSVVTFLDRWNNECERNPSGPSDEGRATAYQHMNNNHFLHDSAGLFLRVAFDVLYIHGAQLACLKRPPSHVTALDNFMTLLSTVLAHDSVEKATAFAKSAILAAFEATRDATKKRKGALLPRPLHRVFMGIVNEILPCERVPLFITLDQLAVGLRAMEPRHYPGFCFSWLEILAHRRVMVPMLSGPLKHQMQDTFVQLLCNAFHMLALMMRETHQVQETVTAFYNGLARVLLTLMHDFPDVLCANHLKFCGNMPSRCIQLRNIVLAAFPKTCVLMDPMTAHSKLDKIPDMAKDPLFTPPPWDQLVERQLLADIETYLQAPAAEAARAFVMALPKRLISQNAAATQTAGAACNNAVTVIVLFLGLGHIQSGCRGAPVPRTSAAFQLFLYLTEHLPPDILRMMFDAIANQLRYPSSHTYYYSSLLLGLFAESSADRPAREIITRVLLERCIALRPHPWGVMMTLCELLKNSTYSFWTQPFVNCTPEYSNLFDKLYRAESLHATLSQSLALPGVTSVHA